MDARFEADMRAGYRGGPPALTLGSPMQGDQRDALVEGSPLRVKYFAAPDRESAAEILGARIASADKVAATPPPPGRRERSVFGTLHVSRR